MQMSEAYILKDLSAYFFGEKNEMEFEGVGRVAC